MVQETSFQAPMSCFLRVSEESAIAVDVGCCCCGGEDVDEADCRLELLVFVYKMLASYSSRGYDNNNSFENDIDGGDDVAPLWSGLFRPSIAR